MKFYKYILVLIAVLVFGFLGSQVNAQEISETEITFGLGYNFNTASTSRIYAADLSSSKFAAVYQDGGASVKQGTAIIGDVSGDAILYGSEYVFNSADTDYLSVTALPENKFAVAYQDKSNSNYGTVIMGDVSGDVITFGSEYIFNTAYTDHISVTALSDNKFVVAYQDNRDGVKQGKALVADVDGAAVSFGNAYTFNTSVTNYTSLSVLSSDKIIVAYQDGGNSDYGTAAIGVISGQAIDFGSEYVFNPSATSHIAPVVLSETKFAIAYQDRGGSLNYGRAIIGNVLGNAIAYGAEYVFNTGATSYVAASLLSKNKFAISYQGNSGLDYGNAIIGMVADDAINFGSKYIFNPASTGCSSVAALSDSQFAIAYQNKSGNLNYGRAVIGSIPVEEIVEPEPEPIPEPEVEAITMNDGDLIRNPNAEGSTKFDIYIVKIVGAQKFKRLILSPSVFESYEHLKWEDVQDVDQTTMDEYTLSNLVRAEGDEKVYQLFPSGDTGTKEIMDQGYDSDSIYTVNSIDINSYE